ncbi:hypothetical protein Goarm_005006 [Gossypium armourianum]|uniref:Plastocyanin-like domain-containing protein n=1 Tax=Gossypium armourianum TaxID=34283 RepID=A0A7J9JYK1_9ROSI|nr:hypothetical protein [Gossypium armourianum]
MGLCKLGCVPWLLGILFLSSLELLCMADVHYYDFIVRESNFTRLCTTKSMLVVNDSYPGPEIRCPIQPGANFTYQVILSDEIGTLWWHAHSDWTRGSVHGAFVILPAPHETYPFHPPDADQTIILESWYNDDYLELIRNSTLDGQAVGIPNAYAINGHLGDTYDCNDTIFRMEVNYQDTYLLRIINAAMNEE